MGIDYNFYSEVKNKDGKWELLNRFKKPLNRYISNAGDIAPTYDGRGFGDLIDYINWQTSDILEGLSPELEEWLLRDENGNPVNPKEVGYGISEIFYQDFRSAYDKLEKYEGYVPIDQLDGKCCDEDYEGCFTCYSVDQYIKLKDAEAKSKLRWHEWYKYPHVERQMRMIMDHHDWMIEDYKRLNGIYSGYPESRIVIYIW